MHWASLWCRPQHWCMKGACVTANSEPWTMKWTSHKMNMDFQKFAKHCCCCCCSVFSIRGLTASWTIFRHCVLSSRDLSDSPVHFIMLSCQCTFGLPICLWLGVKHCTAWKSDCANKIILLTMVVRYWECRYNIQQTAAHSATLNPASNAKAVFWSSVEKLFEKT